MLSVKTYYSENWKEKLHSEKKSDKVSKFFQTFFSELKSDKFAKTLIVY